MGSLARRRLEFDTIVHNVRKNKAGLIARLQRNIEESGDCLLYRGNLDHKGYPRINFRFGGKHVTIGAHRLFVILQTKAPIPLGLEAGHEPHCTSRRCVRHVRLQHYTTNAQTRRKEPNENPSNP